MRRFINRRKWTNALIFCVVVADICLFAANKVDILNKVNKLSFLGGIDSAALTKTVKIANFAEVEFLRMSALKVGSTERKTLIHSNDVGKPYNPSWDTLVQQWTDQRTVMCEGNIVGYNNQFLQIKYAILVNPLFLGPRGGEKIADVIMRNEHEEYYKPVKGAIMSSCRANVEYRFTNPQYTELFDAWQKPNISNATSVRVINDVTLLVIRREYANLYHTMTDWYNVYLTARYFDISLESCGILFLYAHPSGNLDDVWSTLFNRFIRFRDLPGNYTWFRELIWVVQGYDSPIELFSPTNPLPLLEDFRQLFFQRFHLSKTDINRALNCQNVSVLFIWRRNYVAHPRNPSGRVNRQISNERELITNLTRLMPTCNFRGLQMDALPMSTQLRHIVHTDILVGMHGAGLMNSIFLPRHAGLIELVPSYPAPHGGHFSKMASWRSLRYSRWANSDALLETGTTHTYVPVLTVKSLLKDMLNQLHC